MQRGRLVDVISPKTAAVFETISPFCYKTALSEGETGLRCNGLTYMLI